jgi:ethanolamine ammonia-lyase small subunit
MTPADEPEARLAAPDPWYRLRALTPARIALGRAGGSLPTRAHLNFQLDHARARDAVHEALDLEAVAQALRQTGRQCLAVKSAAGDRLHFLQRPDLGRRLDSDSHQLIGRTFPPGGSVDAVFVVADGLSARAVHRHAAPLLAGVCPQLLAEGWTLAPVVLVGQGRVALRNCISNIRPEGLSYKNAAARLHFLMTESRRRRLSGVALKDETGALGG